MGQEQIPQVDHTEATLPPVRYTRQSERPRFTKVGGDAGELLVAEHLYRELLHLLDAKLESGEDLDLDLADAIADAERVKGRQRVCVRLTADQLERLGGWLVERSAYFERAYIEVANRAAEAHAPAV